jgi:hypothetical protein
VQQRFNVLKPKFEDESQRARVVAGGQEADYKNQFVAAFRWLQQARRSDNGKLATNYAVSFWTDAAEQFAHIRISALAFVSAVVAVGDVSYSLDQINWPFGLNFGLSLGSRSERADLGAGAMRPIRRREGASGSFDDLVGTRDKCRW